MKVTSLGKGLRTAAVLCFMGVLATPAVPSIKNWAVVVSAGSKLENMPLAELAKLCKGTQKTWPDGKNFTLVIRDPESPEMKVVIQKLFGLAPNEVKAMIAKRNELRQVVKIVDSEVDLLLTVEATPGAVGIVDVYSINSSVKVLRVDGKLPFDLGYALKGI
jgi:ABC-type phosphate transport system substrate-binding protein